MLIAWAWTIACVYGVISVPPSMVLEPWFRGPLAQLLTRVGHMPKPLYGHPP